MAIVLVVEDDPTFSVVLQVTLREAGHRTWLARSAQEMAAVLITRQSPPDLVILDWMLPGGTGLEALHWLQADSGLRSVPVLVLTAASDPERVSRQALAAGAAAFLKKTGDRSVLLATVNRLIRRLVPAECPLRLSDTQALRPGYPPVRLRPNQLTLLRMLLERLGETVDCRELESRVLPYDGEERGNALRQRIKRLNKRLKPPGIRVCAERGKGYYLHFD